MADRRRTLDALLVSLAHPGVDGVLGSPDVLEELALLGALEGKLAFGTMNRGGVMGAAWELDDRMTAYDAHAIAECGLDGGKVLLRIADDDAGTAPTIEACARAVSECARHGLPIMVEPLPYHHETPGRAKLLDDDDALLRAVAVGASLGYTATSTWLKVPAAKDPARMLACTTLPALILGGSPGPDPEADLRLVGGGDGCAERARPGRRAGAAVPARRRCRRCHRPRGPYRPTRDPVMTMHRPHGSLADGADPVALTPDVAGWSFTGLRVLSLAPGVERSISTGVSEACILPLSATDLTVRCDDNQFSLAGRPSVFARVTDFLYVPRDATVSMETTTGGEVAIATARCDVRLSPRYGPAEGVAVEIRGAGPATRQVNNFMSPEVWDHAARLMCVELLTPDGNWSSYPPHRHDDSPECPVNNEEIYYFRIGRAGTDRFLHRRVRYAPHVHTGRIDRRARRGQRRRRVPRAPRVPRSVHRRPRLHDVLPQRPGRVRR